MDKERVSKAAECILFNFNTPNVVLGGNDMSDPHVVAGVNGILLLDILSELGYDYKEIFKAASNKCVQTKTNVSDEEKRLAKFALDLIMSDVTPELRSSAIKVVADNILCDYDKLVEK